MQHAIDLAQLAKIKGEIPVGAVLVFNNSIISEGLNSSISNHDPTAHAEIKALRKGGQVLKNYRLLNTTLYVTLEPCMMCYGAIFHSRIHRLVFGAKYKHINIKQNNMIQKNVLLNLSITKGILKEQCKNILTSFFHQKRKRIKFKKTILKI